MNLTTSPQPVTPTEIEVLWELNDGRRVWWPASVRTDNRAGSEQLNEATLEYEGKYGFLPSVVEVVFLPGGTVQERGIEGKQSAGPLLSWRIKGTGNDGKKTQHKSRLRARGSILKKDALSQKHLVTSSELRALRKCNANAMSRINTLETKIDFSTTILGRMKGGHASVEGLLARMRHRLILQIQRGLRRLQRKEYDKGSRNINDSYCSGITKTYLATTVGCNLQEFEALALHCHPIHGGKASAQPRFFPSFEFTQGPSQGSQLFQILFPTLGSLCEQLSISSMADRVQMLYKYGRFRGEGAMRIAGTYVPESDADKSASVFFVGASYGTNRSGQNTDDEIQIKHFRLVLKRNNCTWDEADRRFRFPLYTTECHMKDVLIRDDIEPKRLNLDSFLIRWKRDNDASRRAWSANITNPTIVTGTLELSMPCIQIVGNAICDEFTTLLTAENSMKAVE